MHASCGQEDIYYLVREDALLLDDENDGGSVDELAGGYIRYMYIKCSLVRQVSHVRACRADNIFRIKIKNKNSG